MPTFLARPYLKDGRLVRLLPEWRVSPIPLHIVYPPNRHLSNKLRVFVDWTVTVFAAPIPGLSSPV
jgi:DNA-binding transcriptional LysR family regulator